MNLEQITDQILAEVPACPRGAVVDALRWSQRELCTHGLAWVVDDDLAVTGATGPEPEVDTPPDAEVILVMKLIMDGEELKGGRDYRINAVGRVTFLRTITEGRLFGHLSCRPTYGRDMPDSYLARWAMEVKHGALQYLYALPQPWGNLQLSEFYRAMFSDDQTNCRSLYWNGHQAGSIRMRVPRF